MAQWQHRMSATSHFVLSCLFIHQLGRTQLTNIDGALALQLHCRVRASVLSARVVSCALDLKKSGL